MNIMNGKNITSSLMLSGKGPSTPMTSQTSRHGLNFEPPKMLSYHSTWDDADYEPQFPQRRPGPFTRIVAALGARLQAARARRAEISQLAAMSDREVADMGITRCDVARVLDRRARNFEPGTEKRHTSS
jgi:uncharacterized protein YjiS (DUF1127 family)